MSMMLGGTDFESASHGYAAGGITGLEYVYAAGFDA